MESAARRAAIARHLDLDEGHNGDGRFHEGDAQGTTATRQHTSDGFTEQNGQCVSARSGPDGPRQLIVGHT